MVVLEGATDYFWTYQCLMERKNHQKHCTGRTEDKPAEKPVVVTVPAAVPVAETVP